MNKVLILCLFSLLCVGATVSASEPNNDLPKVIPKAHVDETSANAPVPVAKITQTNVTASSPSTNKLPIHSTNDTSKTEKSESVTSPTTTKTSDKHSETATPNVTEKITINTNDKANNTKTTEAPITTQATTTQASTSTNAAKNVSTTQAPVPAHGKIIQKARGFDGLSFFGGIIMALGMTAIGFIGYKYYKNHTDRNYHTL